ncbi:hypothetical protein DN35_2447 [Vibrio cholerae]|nr:hypothetical protein DN42_2418 [Vibrio cholerae]KFE04977.1 hypothetical protein DN35_2447 [Vibrio cholerae]KFE09054.1 hypothetical protein DN36_1932 [Vibrio cholerae]KFE11844.1 hypothetical protein DN37_2643 [Vibrio cholerae]KFE16421.1 hypothetical protein DN38_1645 [Vibrio cholerae]
MTCRSLKKHQTTVWAKRKRLLKCLMSECEASRLASVEESPVLILG